MFLNKFKSFELDIYCELMTYFARMELFGVIGKYILNKLTKTKPCGTLAHRGRIFGLCKLNFSSKLL